MTHKLTWVKPWKTLSSREVYQNRWMRLREDIAQMPTGKTTIYGVVECADCVGVLPFVDADHVVMVRQFRYVFGEDHRWEMPTGGVKPGETAEAAARRELIEEAGYDAGELQLVSTYYTSKSIMREVGHLYIGRALTKVQAIPDETEFFEIAIMPFEQVLHMVNRSEIRDSMTVIAVLQAARLRG
jgi:ADP-ribose pyrophosphatase